MSPKNENIIILACFFLLFIGLVCLNVFPLQHNGQGHIALPLQLNKVLVAPEAESRLEPEKQERPSPNAKVDLLQTWGRDPFEHRWIQKTVTADNLPKDLFKDEELSLTLILISTGERTATINNKILHEGDVIQGERIVKIQENGVILAKNRMQRMLSLRKSSIQLQVEAKCSEGK